MPVNLSAFLHMLGFLFKRSEDVEWLSGGEGLSTNLVTGET